MRVGQCPMSQNNYDFICSEIFEQMTNGKQSIKIRLKSDVDDGVSLTPIQSITPNAPKTTWLETNKCYLHDLVERLAADGMEISLSTISDDLIVLNVYLG